MEELLAALQASGFAQTMRSSTVLYPLANVLHILGALTFFAAVAAMDLRVFRTRSLAGLRRYIARVRPIAVMAFLVQIVSGTMLLAPEAVHIWHNPIFRLKLIAIAIGLVNVVILEAAIRRPAEHVPAAAKGPSAISLAVWLATAALGRLIAYF